MRFSTWCVERLFWKHLFDFADICGLTPREVDALPVLEFLTLVRQIEGRLEARRTWAEKAGKWVP